MSHPNTSYLSWMLGGKPRRQVGVRACGEASGLLGSHNFLKWFLGEHETRKLFFLFIHEMTSDSSGFAGSNFNYCKSKYYKGNPRDCLLADNMSWGSQWPKEHSLLLCLGTPHIHKNTHFKGSLPPTQTLGSVLNLKQLIKKSHCEFFTVGWNYN